MNFSARTRLFSTRLTLAACIAGCGAAPTGNPNSVDPNHGTAGTGTGSGDPGTGTGSGTTGTGTGSGDPGTTTGTGSGGTGTGTGGAGSPPVPTTNDVMCDIDGLCEAHIGNTLAHGVYPACQLDNRPDYMEQEVPFGEACDQTSHDGVDEVRCFQHQWFGLQCYARVAELWLYYVFPGCSIDQWVAAGAQEVPWTGAAPTGWDDVRCLIDDANGVPYCYGLRGDVWKKFVYPDTDLGEYPNDPWPAGICANP